MQYMTAYGALIELGHLKKEDVVLITAASSSVGLAAIQIAKSIGATTVATTRGEGKKQPLLDAGADHVIVTDREDMGERMKTIAGGKGARIIFDPVAGPFLEKQAQHMTCTDGVTTGCDLEDGKEDNHAHTVIEQ